MSAPRRFSFLKVTEPFDHCVYKFSSQRQLFKHLSQDDNGLTPEIARHVAGHLWSGRTVVFPAVSVVAMPADADVVVYSEHSGDEAPLAA